VGVERLTANWRCGNKIYADVGYRRIAEWEERVFT
jgi:hypothetical protein